MAYPQLYQRAILAIRDILAAGGRVLRSSRSFWARFGFPLVNERTDMITAARELLKVSNQVESGGLTGTIAEVLSDAGLPTTNEGGGLTGGPDANIYGIIRYRDDKGDETFRSFKVSLPFYSSLEQLTSQIETTIAGLGAIYGLGDGILEPKSLAIY